MDLHLTGHEKSDGRVWATTADKDPIQAARNPWTLASGAIPMVGPAYAAWEGIDGEHMAHGRNPIHGDFGAREFSSAPGTSVGKAHSEYWDNRNPARDNFAKIIVGHGGEVT